MKTEKEEHLEYLDLKLQEQAALVQDLEFQVYDAKNRFKELEDEYSFLLIEQIQADRDEN